MLSGGDSPETLEAAFLEQDCLFLTFDQDQDEFDDEPDELEEPEDDIPEFAAFQAETGVRPSFGNLHPLEGMRPVLYDEEACAVLVALDALHRFFRSNLDRLGTDSFPAITSRYRIPDPKNTSKKVSVKVSTLPNVADELYEMSEAAGLDDDFEDMLVSPPILHNDIVPEDSFYSLGVLSWEVLDMLRLSVKVHQEIEATYTRGGDGFPVILIQTSRPKAAAMIEQIQAAGGMRAICFNPGEDPFSSDRYDLGILQTQNEHLHLFGEFVENDPIHIQARKKWDQRCKKTKGVCGLVIAKGLKGSTRGNPNLGDMMALFETRSISPKELGLGSLQLMPYLD